MPELSISPEKLAFIIEKAREFDVKQGSSDPDSGSNAADDDMIDVLEDNGRDPVVRELSGFIRALNEDEQVDLVALMRLGRGDGGIEVGTNCARAPWRPAANTTIRAARQRNICWASRCSAISSPTAWTSSASTGPTSASRRIPQARANEDELGVGRRLCSAAAVHSFTSHRTSPRCWSLLGTGKEI